METTLTLTTKDAASYLSLSRRYLEKLRVTGGGPTFIKIGKCVRYRPRDLDEYLDRCSVRSTSEVAERGSS